MVITFLFLLNIGIGCDDPANTAAQDRQRANHLLESQKQHRTDAWVEEKHLVFCYHGQAKEVSIQFGGKTHPLKQLADTEVWTTSIELRDAERGIASYRFILNGDYAAEPTKFKQWRGPSAPPAAIRVEESKKLQGMIKECELESKYLSQKRKLKVYLPPGFDRSKPIPVIYAADGIMIDAYAQALEQLILDGTIRPTVLVGIYSGIYQGDTKKYDMALDFRAREYLIIADPERFELHAKFVTDEVLPWAEREYGVSEARKDRALFGYSNGGRWAVEMGMRSSKFFGHIIAFSLAAGDTSRVHQLIEPTSYYLAAGTWEITFHKLTLEYSQALEAKKVSVKFSSRISGHDSYMWQEEFSHALKQLFPAK